MRVNMNTMSKSEARRELSAAALDSIYGGCWWPLIAGVIVVMVATVWYFIQ